jgi:hypothetical protein
VAVESLGRRELGEEALMEEAGGVEIRQQGELAGWPAVGDQQNLAEVDGADDPLGKEATEALPATRLGSKITIFDCVGYVPSTVLDARQRQPSTESYGANTQTGLILGSTKTMYRYRCHGCLASDPLKTWSHR